MTKNVVKYEIIEYGDDKIMFTRKEPFPKPFPGVPPYMTSSITFNKSDIPDIINALSEYHEQTEEGRDI